MQFSPNFIQTMFTPEAIRLADNPELMSTFINLLAYKHDLIASKKAAEYLSSIRTEFHYTYGYNFTLHMYSVSEEQVIEKLSDNETFYLLVSTNPSPTLSEALH